MKKNVLIMVLVYLSHTIVAPNRPDAIRCGADNSGYDGAMFYPHLVNSFQISHYCQVYHGEERCVGFYVNGSYYSGVGHYDSRRGC